MYRLKQRLLVQSRTKFTDTNLHGAIARPLVLTLDEKEPALPAAYHADETPFGERERALLLDNVVHLNGKERAGNK